MAPAKAYAFAATREEEEKRQRLARIFQLNKSNCHGSMLEPVGRFYTESPTPRCRPDRVSIKHGTLS